MKRTNRKKNRKRNDKIIFEWKKNNVFFHLNKKAPLRLQKMCKVAIAHHKPKNVSHARHTHCKFQPKWIGTHIATCNGTSQFASCSRTSTTHDLQCTFSGTCGKNVHEKRYILFPVLTPWGVRFSLMWIVNKHKLVQDDGKLKKNFFTFMLG